MGEGCRRGVPRGVVAGWLTPRAQVAAVPGSAVRPTAAESGHLCGR